MCTAGFCGFRYPAPWVPYPIGYPIPPIPYLLDTLLFKILCPRDILSPGRDMGPEIPYPWKGPITRDTLPPVDRHTPVKTLPSRNFVGWRQ